MTERTRFEHHAPVLQVGRGCVSEIGDELDRHGLGEAFVVTGSTVGENEGVMEPVREGLGDRFAGVYAGTSPNKRLGTAFDALDYLPEETDVLVGVGGGSSLDLAKVVSVLRSTESSREEVYETFIESGTIPVEREPTPLVAVPTTLAGADQSNVAGVNASTGTDSRSGGVFDPRLMPHAVFYDPDLFATTPEGVLMGSVMNGFNKGIETIYSPDHSPVTDAVAVRGLKLFREGLLTYSGNEALDRLVEAVSLTQYGVSRPGGTTLSILHALGHALRDKGLHQGVAHAVVTPHALRYVFREVDARRGVLAEALGVADSQDTADAVVREVDRVVKTLGVPSRLRDTAGPEQGELGEVAQAVLDDPLIGNVPPGLEPSHEDIEDLLREAW